MPRPSTPQVPQAPFPAVPAILARPALASALAIALAAAAACSGLRPGTPEQRVADRLRGTTWEGVNPLAAGPVTAERIVAAAQHPSNVGERVEFRGDSTVVFTREGATLEATYAVADSAHLRVRPVGSPAGQLVLLNLTNGDTLRMLPNPVPGSRAPVGEWLRARR